MARTDIPRASCTEQCQVISSYNMRVSRRSDVHRRIQAREELRYREIQTSFPPKIAARTAQNALTEALNQEKSVLCTCWNTT